MDYRATALRIGALPRQAAVSRVPIPAPSRTDRRAVLPLPAALGQDRRTLAPSAKAPGADRREALRADRLPACDARHAQRAAALPASDTRHLPSVGRLTGDDRQGAPYLRILDHDDARRVYAVRASRFAPEWDPPPPPPPYQSPYPVIIAPAPNYAPPWPLVIDHRYPLAQPPPRSDDRRFAVPWVARFVAVAAPDRRSAVPIRRLQVLLPVCGKRPHPPSIIVIVPVDPPRWIVPFRRSYLMLHDIRLIRVSDQVEIPCTGLSVRADADSWADTLSAACVGPDAMDLVTATMPLELELQVNGAVWRFIVERPSESLQFGRRTVQLTGRSLTALLAQPFQDPASYTEAQARTAAQLVEGRFPLGEGWDLVWAVPDWLIPAGAWGYTDLDPMGAIADVVGAVRAVVRPDRTERTLRVQARYPVLPWNYGTATPDLTIPDGVMLALARRDLRPEQANGVYVQGGQVGGVLGRVYRALSQGDRLAPAVQHALLTHADAARERRGAQILAGQAQGSRVAAVTLPCDGADYPLAEVGQLVLIQRWEGVRDTVMGVNLAVAVSERAVTVRQTLSLGDDSGNPYARLRRLVDSHAPLLVGEVVTDHEDSTVTVVYPGGGIQRVRGTALVGTSVWVRDGRVEGEAPNLTGYDLPV